MANLSEIIERKENLNLIKTKKYKDITALIRFTIPYSRQNKMKLVILGRMFETCKKYPTKDAMKKAKDMLYDATYTTSTNSIANLLNFTIAYNFVNPIFLEGVKEADFIEFIKDTLFEPDFCESLLKEVIINTKAAINRKLDVPISKARESFYKLVGEDDERYLINSIDFNDDLESITLDDIKNIYNELFKSRIDSFLVGDYSKDFEDFIASIKSNFSADIKIYPKLLDKRADVTEKKDVGQSTLIYAYTTPYTRKDPKYYAFQLANIMFGVIPTSLLFSEVREKNSLCYTISCRSMRYEGLVLVETLIDAKNKDKTVEEIKKQFERMKKADYDVSLLDSAKALLINSALSMDDDIDYLVDYFYVGYVTGNAVNVKEYIEKIQEITIEDITEVFNNYKEYFVYFLEGTKHE